jgi:hypothetical protein
MLGARHTRGENRARQRAAAVRERAVYPNRLALIRAFCAPPSPSMHPQSRPVHNFFCRCGGVRTGALRVLPQARHARAAALTARADKKSDAAETLISSAFSHGREIFAQIDANEKIFRAALRKRARNASRAAADGGACAQNQVESLLFFFCCSNPMAVQLDSRLHLLMSPSTHG